MPVPLGAWHDCARREAAGEGAVPGMAFSRHAKAWMLVLPPKCRRARHDAAPH
jgi:hypothetical protein